MTDYEKLKIQFVDIKNDAGGNTKLDQVQCVHCKQKRSRNTTEMHWHLCICDSFGASDPFFQLQLRLNVPKSLTNRSKRKKSLWNQWISEYRPKPNGPFHDPHKPIMDPLFRIQNYPQQNPLDYANSSNKDMKILHSQQPESTNLNNSINSNRNSHENNENNNNANSSHDMLRFDINGSHDGNPRHQGDERFQVVMDQDKNNPVNAFDPFSCQSENSSGQMSNSYANKMPPYQPPPTTLYDSGASQSFNSSHPISISRYTCPVTAPPPSSIDSTSHMSMNKLTIMEEKAMQSQAQSWSQPQQSSQWSHSYSLFEQSSKPLDLTSSSCSLEQYPSQQPNCGQQTEDYHQGIQLSSNSDGSGYQDHFALKPQPSSIPNSLQDKNGFSHQSTTSVASVSTSQSEDYKSQLFSQSQQNQQPLQYTQSYMVYNPSQNTYQPYQNLPDGRSSYRMNDVYANSHLKNGSPNSESQSFYGFHTTHSNNHSKYSPENIDSSIYKSIGHNTNSLSHLTSHRSLPFTTQQSHQVPNIKAFKEALTNWVKNHSISWKAIESEEFFTILTILNPYITRGTLVNKKYILGKHANTSPIPLKGKGHPSNSNRTQAPVASNSIKRQISESKDSENSNPRLEALSQAHNLSHSRMRYMVDGPFHMENNRFSALPTSLSSQQSSNITSIQSNNIKGNIAEQTPFIQSSSNPIYIRENNSNRDSSDDVPKGHDSEQSLEANNSNPKSKPYDRASNSHNSLEESHYELGNYKLFGQNFDTSFDDVQIEHMEEDSSSHADDINSRRKRPKRGTTSVSNIGNQMNQDRENIQRMSPETLNSEFDLGSPAFHEGLFDEDEEANDVTVLQPSQNISMYERNKDPFSNSRAEKEVSSISPDNRFDERGDASQNVLYRDNGTTYFSPNLSRHKSRDPISGLDGFHSSHLTTDGAQYQIKDTEIENDQAIMNLRE